MIAVVIVYVHLESVVYISQNYQSTMRSVHFLHALNLITTLFYETVSPSQSPCLDQSFFRNVTIGFTYLVIIFSTVFRIDTLCMSNLSTIALLFYPCTILMVLCFRRLAYTRMDIIKYPCFIVCASCMCALNRMTNRTTLLQILTHICVYYLLVT